MDLHNKFYQHFKPLIIILLTKFSQILGSWGDWEVDQSKENDARSCKAILINLGHVCLTNFKIQAVFLNLPICFGVVYWDDLMILVSFQNSESITVFSKEKKY